MVVVKICVFLVKKLIVLCNLFLLKLFRLVLFSNIWLCIGGSKLVSVINSVVLLVLFVLVMVSWVFGGRLIVIWIDCVFW